MKVGIQMASIANKNKSIQIITTLDLQPDIEQLRMQNQSFLSIANSLNEEYKSELDGVVITGTMVQQWCKENLPTDMPNDRKDEILNVYNEQAKLLDIVEEQIDMTLVFIDDIKRKTAQGQDIESIYNRMRALSTDLEKYIGRKQSILSVIQSIQEKILTFQAISDINQEILNAVKSRDESMYDEIVSELQQNKILLLNYQKVKLEK